MSTNTVDESDWAALYAMYIKYNDMDIALALEKKELVIRQAEKWAYSGLKFIKMHLDDDDYANIYNLSNWIIEKPEWYMKKKRS